MDYLNEMRIFENKYDDSLIKYSYYLIGLNIASLGYIVSNTKDFKINEFSILLLISCIFLVLSTLIGLIFLRLKISGKFLKSLYYSKLFSLKKKSTKMSREVYNNKVKVIRDDYENKISPLSNKMIKYYNLIPFLFFAGVVIFILWHILTILKNNQLLCL